MQIAKNIINMSDPKSNSFNFDNDQKSGEVFILRWVRKLLNRLLPGMAKNESIEARQELSQQSNEASVAIDSDKCDIENENPRISIVDEYMKTLPRENDGYLRFNFNERYLLNDYTGEELTKPINPIPDRLVIITLYFITLFYNNEYYVVLDYTSYAPSYDNGGRGYTKNNGIWSVPHSTVFVDIGMRRLENIKAIKDEYENALNQQSYKDKLKILEEDLFYNLGVFNFNSEKDLDKGCEYIEYKHSPTEPDKMRCFYVREFFVKRVDAKGILNLVDPECLHKHYFVPISSLINEIKGKSIFDNVVHQFRGRTIPDNVADVLTSLNYVESLEGRTIDVKRTHLCRRMSGILFKTAISNAHAIYKAFAESKRKGMVEELIPAILEQCMVDMGVKHYFIDRDQIIGVMPDGEKDFTNLLEKLYDKIFNEIFSAIIQNEQKLCLRCTALLCDFSYGRIFGLNTNRPCFSGENYEKLCSMAQDTQLVQMDRYTNFNGILLGWDAKDDKFITFTSAGVIQVSGVKKSAENPDMKFKVLNMEDYVKGKMLQAMEISKTNDSQNTQKPKNQSPQTSVGMFGMRFSELNAIHSYSKQIPMLQKLAEQAFLVEGALKQYRSFYR